MPASSASTDCADFPKIEVFSKPVVTPRPVISRTPSSPTVPAPSLALNLGELKKTQKRVAFLLEKCYHDQGDRYTIFPKSTYQGKCFLCRNSTGDPYTHYQHKRTEGENQTPVIPGRTRRNSVVIPTEWGSGSGHGDTGTPYLPEGDSSSTGTEKVRKKVTLPHITEKQTVSASPGAPLAKANKHGRRIKNGKDFPVYTTENGFKGLRTVANEGRVKKRSVIITSLTGIGSWVEAKPDQDDEEYGRSGRDIHPHERFQKSRRTDSIRLDTPTSGTRTGRYFQFDHKKHPPTREGSVRLSKWCECVSAGITHGECRECGRSGGHEKWCRFETDACPDCGKPVRGKRRVEFRSESIQFLLSSPTNLSITTNDSREGYVTHWTRSIGHQQETSKFTKAGKRRRKRKAKRVATNVRHHSSGVESIIDPNIHRQAYLLALVDARLRQWKSDPWMFENSANSVCFSYFSLWRNPHTMPDSESESKTIPRIGIRGREVKMKIKDPMKHILGSIKLSDYYPSGKKFPKQSDKTDY